MTKSIICAALAVTLAVSTTQASDVGVDVNIRVGTPAPPVVAVPVPAPPPVVIVEPPDFVFAPALGFYVAVGVPHDVVFIGNYYYLYRGNVWYRAPYYNGPWVVTRHKHLPPGLRKHRYERIRAVRDEQFRTYQAERDHFRGKHFRPGKHEMKEMHKEEKRMMKGMHKEEKRHEKEERGHGKGKHGKDD